MILVWQGYGITRAFKFIDTIESMVRLKRMVIDLCDRYYEPDQMVELMKQMSMRDIENWVSSYTDNDENFEVFQIVEEEYL